jgi:hypothetical protein
MCFDRNCLNNSGFDPTVRQTWLFVMRVVLEPF